LAKVFDTTDSGYFFIFESSRHLEFFEQHREVTVENFYKLAVTFSR